MSRWGRVVALVVLLVSLSARPVWASFTHVGANFTSNNGSGGTLVIAVTGVHAGDFVAASASSSGVAGVVSVGDGTSTFATLTEIHTSNSGTELRGFYLLASVASGTVTYTVTYSGTPTSRSFTVDVWTPSSAVVFDGQNGTETIATTSGVSGNITTTGTDELAFAAQANENQSVSSVEQINGVTAAAVSNSGTNHTQWYTTASAPFTGQATETIGSSTRTLTIVAAFKTSGVACTPSLTLLGVGRCG